MNAIDFECPVCGAKPGERCHTITGKANPVSHAKRKQAVLETQHVGEDFSQAAVGRVRPATDDK
jgi:hypothetical protein